MTPEIKKIQSGLEKVRQEVVHHPSYPGHSIH